MDAHGATAPKRLSGVVGAANTEQNRTLSLSPTRPKGRRPVTLLGQGCGQQAFFWLEEKVFRQMQHPSWRCPLCRKDVTRENRAVHLQKHSPHDPCCPVCLKHFLTFGSVREHLHGEW